jgi:hypothetical protein
MDSKDKGSSSGFQASACLTVLLPLLLLLLLLLLQSAGILSRSG